MVRPELATVVACTDGADTWPARGTDAGAHRQADAVEIETVEDDFQHRVDPRGQCGLRDRPQRRTVGIIGRRDHPFVACPDLAAAAHDTAREGKDHVWRTVYRRARRFRRFERGISALAKDQEIAAADPLLLHSERLREQELALHHRDAPVTLAAYHLAAL